MDMEIFLWLLQMQKDRYGRSILINQYAESVTIQKIDTDALILFYKKFISEKLQLGSVEKSPRIQGFLTMRDSEQIPAETTIRYMSIDKREYQNRQRPLPEIREVVCKKQ